MTQNTQRTKRKPFRKPWAMIVVFIGPVMIYYCIFILYPIFATFYYSFHTIAPQAGKLMTTFVGVKNYEKLVKGVLPFWKTTVGFKLNKKALENLQNDGIPDEILNNLGSLKNKKFATEKGGSNFSAQFGGSPHDASTLPLTHKAKSPILRLQKREFLSPHPPHLTSPGSRVKTSCY